MASDRTNPTQDEVRAAWEQFRSATFMRIGDAQDCTVWVWAASQDFDFGAAAVHLRDVQDVKVDIGPGTLALIAYGALHLVPLTSIDARSLDAMQPNVTFDIRERQSELRAAHRRAVERLAQIVQERFSVKAPIVSLHDHQIH